MLLLLASKQNAKKIIYMTFHSDNLPNHVAIVVAILLVVCNTCNDNHLWAIGKRKHPDIYVRSQLKLHIAEICYKNKEAKYTECKLAMYAGGSSV